jgi:hypothetical protein
MEVKALLDKLPQWKSILSAIVGLGAMFWVAYNHFTTDAEAADAHQQIEQKVDSAFNKLRADETRREIKRLELRLLEEGDSMRPAVKDQILRDIADLKATLRCIEEGVCR